MLCHRQILNLDTAGEVAFVVHYKQLAQAVTLQPAQAFQCLTHGKAGMQWTDIGIHQTSCGIFRIAQQFAQLVRHLGVKLGETAFAFALVPFGQYGNTGNRFGLSLIHISEPTRPY